MSRRPTAGWRGSRITVRRQLRPHFYSSFARAMSSRTLVLRACASALAGPGVAWRLARATSVATGGAVAVGAAGGARSAWRSLNALHPSPRACSRSSRSVGTRGLASFNPGSHNPSVERTRNGGRGLRAPAAWSAPVGGPLTSNVGPHTNLGDAATPSSCRISRRRKYERQAPLMVCNVPCCVGASVLWWRRR